MPWVICKILLNTFLASFSLESRRCARYFLRTRRLIKAPKIYWSDTGLALFLASETAPRGVHLENLLLNDLLAWAGAAPRHPNVLHWRTTTGAEVDFAIELPDRLLPIEVKASNRVNHGDAIVSARHPAPS